MTRRGWVAGLVGLVLTVGLSAAGQAAQGKWRIGHDKAVETCLPYRVYLIELGLPSPSKGDIVAFRTKGLQPRFADGTLFTKQVIGLPGDLVEVTASSIRINEATLPLKVEAIRKYGMKRQQTYRLGSDEYFMAGTNPRAYDSRYYGPVKTYQLAGEARPLW